eukprot:TRINITY_DN517_c0_g1_i6.p2 TRINITY_DN517_c0_g1~~TRINITY_DN517_c0_g1_i6.p2  ORF type:complete len:125 (-),score=27.63 TRINITY_DN517_c0_g1_i6:66-440(-)
MLKNNQPIEDPMGNNLNNLNNLTQTATIQINTATEQLENNPDNLNNLNNLNNLTQTATIQINTATEQLENNPDNLNNLNNLNNHTHGAIIFPLNIVILYLMRKLWLQNKLAKNVDLDLLLLLQN